MYKELVYEDENIVIFKTEETIPLNEYGSYTLSRFDPIHIVSENFIEKDKVNVVYYFKEIKLQNGNMIKVIPAKESKRSKIKTIQMTPITLEYVRENYCINCPMYRGKNHDYEYESCSKCISSINNFKYVSVDNEKLNEEYISKMKTLKDESDHDVADYLLCGILEELGYTELVEAYRKVPKWYS